MTAGRSVAPKLAEHARERRAHAHEIGIARPALPDLGAEALNFRLVMRRDGQAEVRELLLARAETVRVVERLLKFLARVVEVSIEEGDLSHAEVRLRVMRILLKNAMQRLPRFHRIAFHNLLHGIGVKRIRTRR